MIDKKIMKYFNLTNVLLVVFILFTLLIKIVDVKPIGPEDSKVGFAALNGAFHNLTGVHMGWYQITKYAGYMIIIMAIASIIYGVFQFLTRGGLSGVDRRLLVLIITYVPIGLLYVLFEFVVINRRPVIINGKLAASYPSTHTFLAISVVLCIMLWLKDRLRDDIIRYIFHAACILLVGTVVIGRLVSGVHWFTDIIGGILLGGVIVSMYQRTIVRMR